MADQWQRHSGDEMAITYPLTPPTTGIAKFTPRAVDVVTTSRSRFTGKQQVIAHSGQWWEADITLPPMERDVAETWVSFLLSLKGARGTFTFGDPAGATAQGSASSTPGTPVVKGAGQTGETLLIDGCPSGVTDYLKAGDYIQLGSASTATLHKVMQDVNTDGSGNANIDIWPDIRNAPSDNATVVVATPVGLWRRASNTQAWNINQAVHYGLSFSIVEAVS